MADWTKKKNQLENTLTKKQENNRPAAEVEKAQNALDEHEATKPLQKWILDARESFRDIIKDPQDFTAGELWNTRWMQNKAGYTATLVACGWAGAIIEVTRSFGQEQ